MIFGQVLRSHLLSQFLPSDHNFFLQFRQMAKPKAVTYHQQNMQAQLAFLLTVTFPLVIKLVTAYRLECTNALVIL